MQTQSESLNLEQLFNDIVINRLKYARDDLRLIDNTDDYWLFRVYLNSVSCGLLCLTTQTSLDRTTHILAHTIMHTDLDFFIAINTRDAVIVLTDHRGRLIPQHIPIAQSNQLELICGKPFIKNLIANRGVEYYGID
jgi:hypothetical protein